MEEDRYPLKVFLDDEKRLLFLEESRKRALIAKIKKLIDDTIEEEMERRTRIE